MLKSHELWRTLIEIEHVHDLEQFQQAQFLLSLDLELFHLLQHNQLVVEAKQRVEF